MLTIACLFEQIFLRCLQNSMHESASRNNGGRLFYTRGPTAEKARSPTLVRIRTVVATVMVADRRRLLLESMLRKCVSLQRKPKNKHTEMFFVISSGKYCLSLNDAGNSCDNIVISSSQSTKTVLRPVFSRPMVELKRSSRLPSREEGRKRGETEDGKENKG